MIKITEFEKKNQKINSQKLKKIKSAFQLDGFVIVENLISCDLLDIINSKLNDDAAHMIFNHYKNHNNYPHHLQLGFELGFS